MHGTLVNGWCKLYTTCILLTSQPWDGCKHEQSVKNENDNEKEKVAIVSDELWGTGVSPITKDDNAGCNENIDIVSDALWGTGVSPITQKRKR